MKNLLKYLKDYKKETVLAPLFKMLEAGFELFVPLVMAKIIDLGIPNNDHNYIFIMGGILLLLGVIGLICSITAQYYSAKAAVGFGTNLRNALFRHIQSLSYSEMDTFGTSTFLTRITSDANQVQTGVNLVLRLFLRSPFIVFGAMVMAFTIDIKAALIFVVAIPLLSLVVFGIMYLTMPYYKKVQYSLDQVLLRVRENLSGVRVIRAFNRQDDERKEFHEETNRLMNIQLRVGKISSLLNPITYIIINGAIILLLWVGGEHVNTGRLSQGEVVALINYMSQILVELIKLANLIITVTKSLACAKRIDEIFQVKPSMIEGRERIKENHEKEYITFSNVTFNYPNAKEPSLENISFSVEKGQTIGVIGGTGSGKSTLIHLIPRFYDVSSGSITISGKNVTQYSYESLRNYIGIVPQKAVLFSGTIRENLCFGNKCASDYDINRAVEIAQAKEFIDSKKDGLSAIITQGGKNLSGGQKQRLTIARALVTNPEILILDDSASALDFATDFKLRQSLNHMAGNTTVFIVSQRATTLKQADQIIVLDDGKIAGIGKHAKLLEQCPVYREICLSQLSQEEIGNDLGKKGNGNAK